MFFTQASSSLDQALLFYTDPQNYLWKTKQTNQPAKNSRTKNLEKFKQFFPWREAIREICHC